MINITQALKDDRLMKASIGLSKKEFDQLTLNFDQQLQQDVQQEYEEGLERGDRKRKPGGGRKSTLTSSAVKLFFTLFYLKCYPTFDVLGLLFDLHRSNAERNIKKLAPVSIWGTKNHAKISSNTNAVLNTPKISPIRVCARSCSA